MGLTVTIRTADRRPKHNYLGQTVRTMLAQGVDPESLHLFPTDPDIAWLHRELDGVPLRHGRWPMTHGAAGRLHVHVPDRHYLSNENGIRQVLALDATPADWIGLFEDDLDLCDAGSVIAWLSDHTDPAFHVYRLFALPGTPLRRVGPFAARAPLREMRGSQAVVLRSEDARLFAAWATAHPRTWRPKDAPFQNRPDRGFDKLIGYWALQQWPKQPDGLVALPMLVNHIGRESMLHTHGVSNDANFAGAGWRYQATGQAS